LEDCGFELRKVKREWTKELNRVRYELDMIRYSG